MRKVWIIVANGSDSRIYRAENVENLVELKTFYHEEAHLNRIDLNSDRPGKFGTDAREEKTSLKVKEATLFAQEIVQFLQEGYNQGAFERLYLIAKAPFLGHIRQSLPENISKLVESEVNKDLTQLKPEQIRDYLPPVL